MRIILVSGAAKISGGAEKIAITSAVKLAERGHSIKLIGIKGSGESDIPNISGLEVQILDPEPLSEGRNLVERAKFIWPGSVGEALKKTLMAERQNSETVVHFHSGYLELGIPGFRALAGSGFKTVYTHHDYTWACPLMGFYDYTTESTCNLKGGSLGCFTHDCADRYLDKVVRYARHFGTHQSSGIGRRVDHHIFVSQTSRDQLLPYLPSATPQTVLYNGIESEKVDRVIASEDSKLTFLGRLTTEKDPVTFALAAAAAGMNFEIVGEGPLRAKLEEAGFGSNLRGWLSGSEASGALVGKRAVVVTSRCKETASLVVMEAAALGVPAVVPSDTAAAEFLHHECTGLVYDRAGPRTLVDSLNRLKDISFANFLGEEAHRQYWAAPPTWEQHLQGLESIYSRVLADV